MEMHQVRYFLAMARELNFTRAADQCNVTQPSLTRAIQKLEDELGGPLFRRERSRTHLTDLGRLMLPHLERTFEAAEAAKQLAKGVGQAQVAPLALGVACTVESTTLDEVLGELGRHLSGFELTVVTGSSDTLIEWALAGSVDLIIVETPDDAPDRLEAWPLFEHLYEMVTRPDHPLVTKTGPRFADARDEPWIDYGPDGRARLVAAAADAGFEPNVRHRAEDLAKLRAMIASGLGSAFMPCDRRDTRLRGVKFIDAEVVRQVVLAAISGRRRSLAADTFVRASRARGWAPAAAQAGD